MFRSEIDVKLNDNRLIIKYFEGVIAVDVESNEDAAEYLRKKARDLSVLRYNLLREAEKLSNKSVDE